MPGDSILAIDARAVEHVDEAVVLSWLSGPLLSVVGVWCMRMCMYSYEDMYV